MFTKYLKLSAFHTKYKVVVCLLSWRYISAESFRIGSITGTEKNAFFTNDEFKEGVSVLNQVIKRHSDSILGQIGGIIPSTWEGQEAEPDKLINCDDIDILKMGGT